jgi:type IV pilus assembly protein PilN
MIKINLLTERKQAKARTRAAGPATVPGGGRNSLMIGVLLLGVAIAGGWTWTLRGEIDDWHAKISEADRELQRLAEVRKKAEEHEAQKALLARKIDLITDLKKQQAVPVHILDQVSRSLPEFLWLDAMSSSNNKVTISGKATTYTAVSNFYSNLSGSGFFSDVNLGRTFQVPEGVAFSLTCQFSGLDVTTAAAAGSES